MTITISDLINGHAEYGLWHGTRAVLHDRVDLGTNALGDAQHIIKAIWGFVSESRGCNLSEIHSEDATNFFNHPNSKRNAIAIGNSIRYLRQDFEYSVIAFAFTRFAANGYATDGSELANAILALTEAFLLEYKNDGLDSLFLGKINHARDVSERIIFGDGSILKLIKMPENGMFFVPGNFNEKINILSSPPFLERIMFTELFFNNSIPLDHFSIEKA